MAYRSPRYCDDNHLTPRDRLELFVPVCQAIQHAHQKGIIHRDVKPSNVMITLYDGKPVPKVIDFGVAKATEQKLTERTLFTQYGTLIGTLEYMSPEQAEMSALGVDTRSDIYSLGVLLYELLTGSTPLTHKLLKEAAYGEILRRIKEEEAPKPSTRLSQSGQALASISAQRRTEPAELSKLMRGELDWIVMKTLEKDRNRRYESAAALASDVERYLNDETVQACPPSAMYRFRKFSRRHKVALGTGTIIALAVMATVVVLAISNQRISRETEQKEAALTEARRNYEASEANLLLARQAVDEIYGPVANELAVLPHMQPYQRDVLEKTLRFYQEFAKRKSSDPTIRLGAAEASLRVARIQYSLGQHAQYEAACRAVIASFQQLEPELRLKADRRLGLAAAMMLLGNILRDAGRVQEAEGSIRLALAGYAELVADSSNIPEYRRCLAACQTSLAILLRDRPNEAEQNHNNAIRLCEGLVKEWPDDPHHRGELVNSYFQLGSTLAGMHRLPEAEASFRQAIAVFEKAASRMERSVYRTYVPLILNQLGKVLAARGRTEDAETAFRQTIVLGERLALQFPDMPGYRQAMSSYYVGLAKLLSRIGRREEAAKLGRLALDLTVKLTAEFAQETRPTDKTLDSLTGLAADLRDAGEFQGAERACRTALELATKLAADSLDDPSAQYRLAETHGGLGTILLRAGRFPEAAAAHREQLAIYDKLAMALPADPDYRYRQARVGNFLGIALRGTPMGREDAILYHRNGIKLCDQLVVEFPNRPRFRHELLRSHYALSLVFLFASRENEAEQQLRLALAGHKPMIDTSRAHGVPSDYEHLAASVHNDLAWILATRADVKARDHRAAVELARKAVDLAPNEGNFWNTLGAAEYRAGNWNDAIAALKRRMDQSKGGDSFDWFFLAMAHWQLGDKVKARQWHNQAVQWMDKNLPKNPELRRFREESEALLNQEKKPLLN